VPQFTLDDVAGDLSAQSLSGPYKVSATYSFQGHPQDLRFSTSEPDAAGLLRIKAALRDLDRNTTYLLDGGVAGLGGKPVYDGTIVVRAANVVPGSEGPEQAGSESENQPAETARRDKASLFELRARSKPPLTAPSFLISTSSSMPRGIRKSSRASSRSISASASKGRPRLRRASSISTRCSRCPEPRSGLRRQSCSTSSPTRSSPRRQRSVTAR
jgi:hypothetical protein